MNFEAKVVLTSGYPLSMISKEIEISQLDGFIEKPIKPSKLLKELAKAISPAGYKTQGEGLELPDRGAIVGKEKDWWL